MNHEQTTLPDFDGATYRRPRDHARLGAELVAVRDLMADGNWRTLARIYAVTGRPQASISARLRDLRKAKFGGHAVDRRYIGRGLWEYRLTLNPGDIDPCAGDPSHQHHSHDEDDA